ncbi:leucyl aminopeptidase [Mesorhizobium sp. BAC0120]|uniref:leucyl aminopeptidase n=1 Tax=Mesorhizobium sp. BAC0120 TaxID=3090670 RepID=UPI00298C40DD|nr:leucyl aminopeptidase [Mesorhizobium sp. BAC0120]MDW6022065.1 leucyl aminopeptidase [Mesorhizobium sp. BAC0120]
MPQSPATVFETAAALPDDAPVVVVLKALRQGFGKQTSALDTKTGGTLSRACTAPGFSGKSGECLDIVAPNGLAARRVVVLGLGDPVAMTPLSVTRAGADLAAFLENKGENDTTIVVDTIENAALADAELAARLALGMRLKRYRFDLRNKRPGAAAEAGWVVRFAGLQGKDCGAALTRMNAVADGVEFARTLVNLPANILHPGSFLEHLGPLREAGIEIETLDDTELKRLGMNALLAVGSASVHPPRVIVLRYRGENDPGEPLAFVGKGVCFDSGGLCAKTGPQMFDMKGDMAGAAAVAGLLLALARQGSKVDAVGVLGIAENLPSGKSYKSGDVITTLSGQTVEVFDTDCEGRMLLADCLYYTATRFKPSAIVDLATLTYSVMRGLGSVFAGLFSNDDAIASSMIAAGEAVGERFWRMPLDHAYDEGLQSPLADLRQHARNLEDGDAPYAAAFLRNFTDNRPWVHLDIAGKEFSDADGPLGRQGGTGFGVQMLEQWVCAVEAGKRAIAASDTAM